MPANAFQLPSGDVTLGIAFRILYSGEGDEASALVEKLPDRRVSFFVPARRTGPGEKAFELCLYEGGQYQISYAGTIIPFLVAPRRDLSLGAELGFAIFPILLIAGGIILWATSRRSRLQKG